MSHLHWTLTPLRVIGLVLGVFPFTSSDIKAYFASTVNVMVCNVQVYLSLWGKNGYQYHRVNRQWRELHFRKLPCICI